MLPVRLSEALGEVREIALVITSDRGPHVTPQRCVWWAGYLWAITPRTSVKAKRIGDGRRVALAARVDSRVVLVRGEAWSIDPLRPWTLLRRPLAASLLGGALARYAVRQLSTVVGAIRDLTSIRLDAVAGLRSIILISPRSIAVIEPGCTPLLHGPWDEETMNVDGFSSDAALEVVVGVDSPAGPVALPARHVGGRIISVPTDLMGTLGDDFECAVYVGPLETEGRPSQRVGAMARGTAKVIRRASSWTDLRIDTNDVLEWQGADVHRTEAVS